MITLEKAKETVKDKAAEAAKVTKETVTVAEEKTVPAAPEIAPKKVAKPVKAKTAKPAKVKATEMYVNVQFHGYEVTMSELQKKIADRVAEISDKQAKEINVYLNCDEGIAYFTIDGVCNSDYCVPMA